MSLLFFLNHFSLFPFYIKYHSFFNYYRPHITFYWHWMVFLCWSAADRLFKKSLIHPLTHDLLCT